MARTILALANWEGLRSAPYVCAPRLPWKKNCRMLYHLFGCRRAMEPTPTASTREASYWTGLESESFQLELKLIEI
jgi:hypothetical protein